MAVDQTILEFTKADGWIEATVGDCEKFSHQGIWGAYELRAGSATVPTVDQMGQRNEAPHGASNVALTDLASNATSMGYTRVYLRAISDDVKVWFDHA